MAKLVTKTAKDLVEYLNVIDDMTNDPLDPAWFRGVGSEHHKLIPSLYRHPDETDNAKLLDLERKMLVRFRERSLPYLESPLADCWEFLFLMQHHGVPTRLLDWTESPMIALFFALTSAHHCASERDRRADSSVWVLSPRMWNREVFKHVSYSGGAISFTERIVSSYKPGSDEQSGPPALPAAILGIHNSPRIVAQKGVFTIFGSETTPMEEIFESGGFHKTALTRIVIPNSAISELLKKLMATGHTDSAVFPSLDGLAREMKRIYGYERS